MNRLVPKSGKLPDSWRQRMNASLGPDDWYSEFHKVETERDLLGDHRVQVKASMNVTARNFNVHLKKVFAGVTEQRGVLRNLSNVSHHSRRVAALSGWHCSASFQVFDFFGFDLWDIHTNHRARELPLADKQGYLLQVTHGLPTIGAP